MARSPLHLTHLPNEILHAIFAYLDTPALKAASLSSSCGYEHAATFLWNEVDLIDQRRDYSAEEEGDNFGLLWGHTDEHDDTPIVQKLLLLASNPFIASKVQTLTHRCHLPCPGIFNELPNISFKSRTLTSDYRTLVLLDKAINNMQQVQTLRIIYGHWNLTLRLLYGFLIGKNASRLKKLWLENVCLEGLPPRIIPRLALPRLESLRLRRLHLYEFAKVRKDSPFLLARGGLLRHMVNGRAGRAYTTTVNSPAEEERNPATPSQGYPLQICRRYDQYMYDNIPEAIEYLDHIKQNKTGRIPYGDADPGELAASFLYASSLTLTSLNIDWIMWAGNACWEFLKDLTRIRFPNLTSFQLRNAVVDGTKLPPDIYLLEPCRDGSTMIPDFIEEHSKLKCLAWPMDRFFSAKRPSAEVVSRARRIVAELGRTLVDLRVDAYYSYEKEPLTDQPNNLEEHSKMVRRRRFVEEFAPYMTKIKSLKMEGGIPRDEKREVIKAMAACPLEKIVFIGVSCPIGNTWGHNGNLLTDMDEGRHDAPGLDEEADDAIKLSMSIVPFKQVTNPFVPMYGWPAGPPMVHTVAGYHAATAKELKFCGSIGSPILYQPTPITDALLYPLRYFHNLEQLVLSMWLLTWYNGEYQDDSIIKFWLDISSSSSTALVLASPATAAATQAPPTHTPAGQTPPAAPSNNNDNILLTPPAPMDLDTPDPDLDTNLDPSQCWSRLLHTMYSPDALARQVALQLGPHLSEQAKARPGGVYVRTSFCLGVNTADIFDLDVWIGTGNTVLRGTRPRAEQESPRRREKLEARRWF